MSVNASLFILDNIEKSFEIYKAINSIDNFFFSQVDKAMRLCFEQVFSSDWGIFDELSLNNDYGVYTARKELWFKDEDGMDDARIWVDFSYEDDAKIWDFFGIPTGNSSFVGMSITMENVKDLPDSKKMVEEIVTLIDSPLRSAGFTVKIKKQIPHYKFPIQFNNKDVVNAIKDENWDEALKPVMNIAKIIADLDWDKIIGIVNQK